MSASITHEPIPLPIVIGVTGHRDIDLGSDEIRNVRDTVRCFLTEMQRNFGDAMHVMTALAAGADQLVAEEAVKLNIPLVIALPMPQALYVCRFSPAERLNFKKLINDRNVALIVTLPHVAAAGNTSLPGYDELHYEQLGAFIARRSHILLALWEGPANSDWASTPTAPGGTADVLRLRVDPMHAALSE